MGFFLEVVCGSLEDCIAAEEGGADRVELCSALELGGLSPSIGLVRSVLEECNIPVMAMVRPRTGGFAYTEGELTAMERDADALQEAGVHGIVFGILASDGTVDDWNCRRLLSRISPRVEKVFHKAFDVTPEPFQALETLIDLGFTRVLTGGQAASAFEGKDLLRQLRERGAGRIEILPGGGIKANEVTDLINATRLNQVHMSFFEEHQDPSMAAARLAFNGRPALEGGYRTVSLEGVRLARQALGSTQPSL